MARPDGYPDRPRKMGGNVALLSHADAPRCNPVAKRPRGALGLDRYRRRDGDGRGGLGRRGRARQDLDDPEPQHGVVDPKAVRDRVDQARRALELDQVVLALALVADLVGEGPSVPVVIALDDPARGGDLSLDVAQDLRAALILDRGRDDGYQVVERSFGSHRDTSRVGRRPTIAGANMTSCPLDAKSGPVAPGVIGPRAPARPSRVAATVPSPPAQKRRRSAARRFPIGSAGSSATMPTRPASG